MANFTIPDSQKRILTKQRFDTQGIQTFNLDLTSKLDKIKTSRQLVKVLDETDHLDDSNPCAFERYKNDYYLATSGELYRCSIFDDPTDPANWNEATAFDGNLSSDSDLVVFDNLLLASSGGTSITSFTGTIDDTGWASGKLTTSGADFTQMYVWKGDGEWLFVANNNKVHYYQATAGEFIITLPEDLEVVGFSGGVSRVWVATRSTTDKNAYVYEVIPGRVYSITDDSGGTVVTVPLPENAYEVDGKAAMSIAVIDNVPHIVTDKGNIQAFNGAGFTTIAAFPFANTTESIDTDSVHPKGMRHHNQSIYINLASDRENIGDYPVDTPSGVWEYNRETGQLYHRFAFAEVSGDFGWRESNRNRIGPIFITNDNNAFIFAIAQREPDSSNLGVYIDQESNYGYFITPEIESDSVTHAWEAIYQKAKTLSSGQSIRLKYRATKFDREFADCTFAKTNQINTADTLTNVAAGWEVTNTLNGKTAHIVSISSGTTREIVLDRDLGTIGDTARFEFNNWTLVPEEYTSEHGEWKQDGTDVVGPWIQFKVEFIGDIEYREFGVKSNSKSQR